MASDDRMARRTASWRGPGGSAGGSGGGGYYANPQSPIASTPQRRRPRQAAAAAPAPVPESAAVESGALSPLRGPAERPLVRKDGGKEETYSIFSPVLKFFNAEDEEGGGGGGGGAGAGEEEAKAPSPISVEPAEDSGAAPVTPVRGVASSGPTVDVAAAVAASAASMGHAVTVDTHATPSSAVTPVSTGAGADAGAEDEEYEYEFDEFNPYLFIKLLPPYSSVAPSMPRIVLPKKSRKAPLISLVLDLDETLVHCSVDPIPDADLTFPVEFNGTKYMVFVRKRPYLDRFFEAIADKFEVTVFTASQRVYAQRLLDLLDPENRFVKYRLYRDSCLNVDGNYLKDLNVLGRDLRHTILVDNSPHAFGYQVDNGIPIESWFDDPHDTELLKLANFLEPLVEAPDVRPVLRSRFNMQALVDNCSLDGWGRDGPREPGTL